MQTADREPSFLAAIELDAQADGYCGLSPVRTERCYLNAYWFGVSLFLQELNVALANRPLPDEF